MLAERARLAFVVTGATAAVLTVAMHRRSPSPVETPMHRALAAWSRSCAAPRDGLCVSYSPRATPHCGPESRRAFAVNARSAVEAAVARSDLDAAITAYELVGGSHRDYAMAKLALADDELERYLALGFPHGLDFGPEGTSKDESIRRFEGWIRAKSELGEHLRDRYNAVIALGDPVASVVAASRMGTIPSSFADELFAAEIPVDVRTGETAQDKIDAYCDALTTAAEPLETPATAAFTACVRYARDHADDLGFMEIARAAQPCVDALVALHPEQFPALDEAIVAPERTHLQLRLGITEGVAAETDYDRENTRGVALRVEGDFARAHEAYARAIALDDARPEAHYNVGILDTFEAQHTDGLDAAMERYQRASESFLRAATRASGPLHAAATEHVSDAQNVIHQLREFQAQELRAKP